MRLVMISRTDWRAITAEDGFRMRDANDARNVLILMNVANDLSFAETVIGNAILVFDNPDRNTFREVCWIVIVYEEVSSLTDRLPNI